MSYGAIKVEREGALLHVRLAVPERRNALSAQMISELITAFEAAVADADVRVIVLSGEGKAFCSGADFTRMTQSTDSETPLRGGFNDLLLAMMRIEKPIVAKVQGMAFGGGLGLVAASTFAFAATDAKVGTPEVLMGLFPMMIMAVLARHVPRRRLLQMMLLGEKIDAAEAERIGLVNRAVAPEALDDAVRTFAGELASKSPAAIRLGLRAFADQDDLALEAALPMLSERLAQCLATDDAREGITAFFEKRPPVWTGK